MHTIAITAHIQSFQASLSIFKSLTLSYPGFWECKVTRGGSKVPAARKTTKTVEIAKKNFISLKAYVNATRTQKLNSLGQKKETNAGFTTGAKGNQALST